MIAMKALAAKIKQWGAEFGFQQVGITDCDLGEAEGHLRQWLQQGFHGEMEYMARHGDMRSHPQLLLEGTLRVISVRMDYLHDSSEDLFALLSEPATAFIARYALGRDYHKTLRRRLAKLARRISEEAGGASQRVFVDSAPVLEKPLAQKAGLGWIGKHSNLINRRAGSWFFLGEIYTDLPLPVDTAETSHCGSCTACMEICPTRAIVAPYVVDARRCISYLTIELKGSLPLPLRARLGNRIYGCDDCMAACPWNRFARASAESDFLPRHGLEHATLLELFAWDRETFLHKTEGSAIRRIGHERWQRNLAVALGNGVADQETVSALRARLGDASPLVQEHIAWALQRLLKGC
jgi:epoxyqueuosine reductase